jgi:hypothetical protein
LKDLNVFLILEVFNSQALTDNAGARTFSYFHMGQSFAIDARRSRTFWPVPNDCLPGDTRREYLNEAKRNLAAWDTTSEAFE